MKKLFVTLLIVLTSLSNVFAQDIVNKTKAELKSVRVFVNGKESKQTNFKVGDKITLSSEVEDMGIPDVRYQYNISNVYQTLAKSNYNSSNTASFIISNEMALANDLKIFVTVRNFDRGGARDLFDDVIIIEDLNVSNGINYQPAQIDSIEIYKNGKKTNRRTFRVGETVTFITKATDPNDLPIRYTATLINKNYQMLIPSEEDIERNETTYTFTEYDKYNGELLYSVAVRNNDDKDGMHGDDLKHIAKIVVIGERKEEVIDGPRVPESLIIAPRDNTRVVLPQVIFE